MTTRVAMISIVVEKPDHIEDVNQILHEYSSYIIGRMGIPYKERAISLISVAMDAPADKITSKALYAKIQEVSNASID